MIISQLTPCSVIQLAPARGEKTVLVTVFHLYAKKSNENNLLCRRIPSLLRLPQAQPGQVAGPEQDTEVIEMSIAAPHYAKFYEEVAESRVIWSIRDAGGFPAPVAVDGKRAMPFWSSRSRAEKVISTATAYSGFEPVPIPLNEFMERWVPGLGKDGLCMGINWVGASATGYDIKPAEFLRNIQGILAVSAPNHSL